ncbi:MAG: hypothetical protein KDM64_09590 [Verrucomicrobiae bacterium]|nr:hypothetical protein [Verrucomicrobiae bacterium]
MRDDSPIPNVHFVVRNSGGGYITDKGGESFIPLEPPLAVSDQIELLLDQKSPYRIELPILGKAFIPKNRVLVVKLLPRTVSVEFTQNEFSMFILRWFSDAALRPQTEAARMSSRELLTSTLAVHYSATTRQIEDELNKWAHATVAAGDRNAKEWLVAKYLLDNLQLSPEGIRRRAESASKQAAEEWEFHGDFAFVRGEYQEAIHGYQKARKSLESAGINPPQSLTVKTVSSEHLLADTFLGIDGAKYRQHLENAASLLEALSEKPSIPGSPGESAFVRLRLGEILALLATNPISGTSEDQCAEALKISLAGLNQLTIGTASKYELAHAYTLLGRTYLWCHMVTWRRETLDSALDAFQKAVAHFDKNNDAYYWAATQRWIARMRTRIINSLPLGQSADDLHEGAMNAYNEALKVFDADRFPGDRAETLISMAGTILTTAGRTSDVEKLVSALPLSREAAGIAEKSGDTVQWSDATNILGQVLSSIGRIQGSEGVARLDEAADVFQSLLDKLEGTNSLTAVRRAHTSLAEVMLLRCRAAAPSKVEAIHTAATQFRTALRLYGPEEQHIDQGWTDLQLRLGEILFISSGLPDNPKAAEDLRDCIAAFEGGLESPGSQEYSNHDFASRWYQLASAKFRLAGLPPYLADDVKLIRDGTAIFRSLAANFPETYPIEHKTGVICSLADGTIALATHSGPSADKSTLWLEAAKAGEVAFNYLEAQGNTVGAAKYRNIVATAKGELSVLDAESAPKLLAEALALAQTARDSLVTEGKAEMAAGVDDTIGQVYRRMAQDMAKSPYERTELLTKAIDAFRRSLLGVGEENRSEVQGNLDGAKRDLEALQKP